MRGSLYTILYEEEFNELDRYFKERVAEGQVIGKTNEAIQNVEGSGYMTPHYFVSTFTRDEVI
ncbi:DUF1672 family protein [Bacillus sp. CH30_1T]|uniref:DUF1672 family protein n=1 Tax=Bacillus sp. CH30_1T TaxID=2604836 RepID=UPI0011EF062B|nr:DUF1672 family protein [Bacillus sp. CH30_1T]